MHRPKKQKRIIFAARRSPPKRFQEIASQFSSLFMRDTVRNTKNRSMRKEFQYKSTIKPVIICVLYSLKHFNFTKQVRRSKFDFQTAAISPLDKTTICPPSAISSPILLVETFEFSLEVPLSIYRFEKMCFPSKDAKLAYWIFKL